MSNYQAFYRKYRPSTFSDVVGQEHITDVLRRQLAAGNIFHAYLFTGTRGTGKTTCAKILAKAVNCLNLKDGDPCGECESCINVAAGEVTDITEIDAASNNSVDSIRELRDQVNFAPATSKYRVYIIDEVHMLSLSAFNALLKTLEEPPKHVVFVLATTEVHKLPATILSRCQRFDFRRIDTAEICRRIGFVCESEGLEITPDAATLIAAAADGGMRDALSILDLCASKSRNIDESVVTAVCGLTGNEYLNELARYLKVRDVSAALSLVDRLYSGGVDMLRLSAELTAYYRNLMIIKTVKGGSFPIICSNTQLEQYKQVAEDYELREILRSLSLLQDSASKMQNGDKRCELEMLIIKMCSPALCADTASLEQRIADLEKLIKSGAAVPAPKAASTPVITETAPADTVVSIPVINMSEPEDEPPLPEAPPAEQNEVKKAVPEGDTLFEQWDTVMQELRATCPLIAGVLSGSKAYVRDNLLLIDCANEQFLSLIRQDARYKEYIKRAALNATGKTYNLGPYRKAVQDDNADPLTRLANKLKQFEV